MSRTLVQRFVGDVRMVVRCTSRPTTEEFDEHLSEAVAMSDSTRVVLVVLVGDGSDLCFDAEQRAKLSRADMFSKPHAVLAPSIRPEVVLSMKWLGAHIRTFRHDALDVASDFLEIAWSLRQELHQTCASTKSLVGLAPDVMPITFAARSN